LDVSVQVVDIMAFVSDYPDILSQWCFEKNTEDPKKVKTWGEEKYYFMCSEGHVSHKVVASVKAGYGCEVCRVNRKRIGARELVEQHFSNHYKDKFTLLDYVSSKKPCKIRCNVCGFIITRNKLKLCSSGVKCRCPQCFNKSKEENAKAREEIRIKKAKQSPIKNKANQTSFPSHTTESYANELIKRNRFILDDDQVYVNRDFPLNHKCSSCGKSRKFAPKHGLNGSASCDNCRKRSVGEHFIKTYLDSEAIEYEVEKSFPGLVYKAPLRFDFYIPSVNMAIEFDGEHHFEDVSKKWKGKGKVKWKGSFEKVKIRDELKNQYCQDNNIFLLRIPYWLRRRRCLRYAIEAGIGEAIERRDDGEGL
jgi:hypothetical protein